MVADCIDADAKCCHMAYIQLSLYRIPAIVHHGNSLTMEMLSHWMTPMYIMYGWSLWKWWKHPEDVSNPSQTATEPTQNATDATENKGAKPEFDVELHEAEHGQIRLF